MTFPFFQILTLFWNLSSFVHSLKLSGHSLLYFVQSSWLFSVGSTATLQVESFLLFLGHKSYYHRAGDWSLNGCYSTLHLISSPFEVLEESIKERGMVQPAITPYTIIAVVLAGVFIWQGTEEAVVDPVFTPSREVTAASARPASLHHSVQFQPKRESFAFQEASANIFLHFFLVTGYF